eukprot:316592-Prymnesium_polylepis.1
MSAGFLVSVIVGCLPLRTSPKPSSCDLSSATRSFSMLRGPSPSSSSSLPHRAHAARVAAAKVAAARVAAARVAAAQAQNADAKVQRSQHLLAEALPVA